MKRTQVIMEVRALTDAVPGAFYEPEDHAQRLRQQLKVMYPWYFPKVKLVGTTQVEVSSDGSIKELPNQD